jgi:aspartate aminotransferase
MFYTAEELAALAEVCIRHDLYLVSDEIYGRLVYDGKKAVSIASLGKDLQERTLVINGVSKTYAMTGWRIGYTLANPELTKAMSCFVSHSTSAPATFAQWGAVEALRGPQDDVERMRQAFEHRRDLIVSRINAVPGISCLKPEGAFYAMVSLRQLIGKTLYGTEIRNADDFASLFLDRSHVAVVPCTGFAAPEYIRMGYATSDETINTGIDRLAAFLQNA